VSAATDAQQTRHEAPAVGDAVVRMMRALVRRAGEGDWEAIEQLQRIAGMAPYGLRMGVRLAHDDAGYSWAQLGAVLNTSRQNAQQLGAPAIEATPGAGHVLVPGHHKRTCPICAGDTPGQMNVTSTETTAKDETR
jgi:hypothetical protein